MELICHDVGIVQMVKKYFISLAKNIIYFSENIESMDLCGLVCAISVFQRFIELNVSY